MRFLLALLLLLASLTTLSSAAEISAPPADGKANVLLITGQDGPWHDWKKTAPVLAGLLQQDPRLHVRVVQDPAFLADPSIHQYDALVLHFVNWEVPSPGKTARENFKKYLTGGKGVVLIHFACGAWQDWPEFRGLVARVWDPKARPHDPRGPFEVTIASSQHPIVAGLKPFQADDELYTCLTGDRPIEVLAEARSKVDGKIYPMAFAYTSGKGRVFQCLLGHDVKAMQMPGVGELYRRGCAWAAGLPPVSETATRAPRTKLMKDEVIRIAEDAAKTKGYELQDYNMKSCHYGSKGQRHTWTVFFDHKPPGYPGGHFLVCVDDETKEAKLMRGK